MKRILISLALLSGFFAIAQSPLPIPPVLTGTTFNLNIQNGITQFYSGINTPTYGINGALLAPTLLINKNDLVTMNVTNNLTGSGNSTTIHWHGLHVPAMADGGPHQNILQGATWSPSFTMLNNAGTFWYHPHGNAKTDLHVSKGIAGMIIVKDSMEATLTLPRRYGIDDFPIIVQSKAFDILHQIAISTEMDTAICVNGAIHPYLDAPAQVIRLRILNGSSTRSYNFGFTADQPFQLIATDGGLIDSSITLTRILLSPGERVEVLLDLQGMLGQTIFLNAYNSELPNGIYGAATVTSMMGGTIPDYDLNPLNGIDFEILQINVVAQTLSPITTLPTTLVPNIGWTAATVNRNFVLRPDTMMDAAAQVIGPFNINGVHFDMDVINVTTYLNNIEKWRITNNTGIAHPFHIHDMHFFIQNVNGGAVPIYEQGKKDVVLVMPQQYVEFITKFENFADNEVPYMYHCHLLHHEDDGMMGSFIVLDTTANAILPISNLAELKIFPNPIKDVLNIQFPDKDTYVLSIFNSLGEKVYSSEAKDKFQLETSNFVTGMYILQLNAMNKLYSLKFFKE